MKTILALDTPDEAEAIDYVRAYRRHVAGFKVGLELFCSAGPGVVGRIARLAPVMLDLKLHDIPRTVAHTVRRLRDATWTTVHSAGGVEMMRAAVEAAEDEILILAITELTSLPSSIYRIEVAAKAAAAAGCTGVVCGGGEVARLRSMFPDLKTVAVGLRWDDQGRDDHARVSRPADAIRAGADLLVLGRAVLQYEDPVAVIREIESAAGGAI